MQSEEKRRKEPGRRWVPRFAGVVVAAGLATGVLVLTSSASQTSGHGVHQRAPHLARAAESAIPNDVFITLKRMNRKLDQMIDRNLTGEALKDAVQEVEDVKHRNLIKEDFAGQTVFGLSFARVYFNLESIDVFLETALRDDANGHEEAKKTRLKAAKAAKDRLERLLTNVAQGPLRISPISANFVDADRATYYTVPTVTNPSGGAISYRWTLDVSSPAAKVDPNFGLDTNCNNHGVLTGTASQFVWHHGNTGDPVHDDGCDHMLQGQYGHQGLITVKVTDSRGQSCTATYKGTRTSGEVAGAASSPSCTGAGS